MMLLPPLLEGPLEWLLSCACPTQAQVADTRQTSCWLLLPLQRPMQLWRLSLQAGTANIAAFSSE
jgi:hypothetical protein